MSCHASGSAQTGMELDVTNPATTLDSVLAPLVDQVSLSGAPFIDSQCVEESFLLNKLTSQPIFGSRMPPSPEPAWTNDEIEWSSFWKNI